MVAAYRRTERANPPPEIQMNDFATRLEEICRALESADFGGSEEFSAATVAIGKKTALTMCQELRAYLTAGASEVEALAAFPFALAFAVNAFLYCTPSRGDAAAADRIMEVATRITHSLGAGDAQRLFAERRSSENCH
jgi:hypothetical protein